MHPYGACAKIPCIVMQGVPEFRVSLWEGCQIRGIVFGEGCLASLKDGHAFESIVAAGS